MRLIASFDDISLSFFGCCLQGLTRNNIHQEQADEVVVGDLDILVAVVNMSLWLMSLSITSYAYFGVADRMSDSFEET